MFYGGTLPSLPSPPLFFLRTRTLSLPFSCRGTLLIEGAERPSWNRFYLHSLSARRTQLRVAESSEVTENVEEESSSAPLKHSVKIPVGDRHVRLSFMNHHFLTDYWFCFKFVSLVGFIMESKFSFCIWCPRFTSFPCSLFDLSTPSYMKLIRFTKVVNFVTFSFSFCRSSSHCTFEVSLKFSALF